VFALQSLKLFCFSHAGGSTVGFTRWKKLLDPRITLYQVELNGRGKKGNLPFYTGIDEAVEDLSSYIMNEAGSEPYAFIGHSMGTIIAYEMCHYLKQIGFREPEAVVFSGRSAPDVKLEENHIHHLADELFIEEIKKLGHSPAELFQNPELLQIFVPILKADYRLIETYLYKERAPLKSDFFLFTGKEDIDTSTEQFKEKWAIHTEGLCEFHVFEGGHFFLYEQTDEVIKTIHTCLMHAYGMEG
jgi:medium-chain acyl-[acyl-carrier-protein] hydrolase